MLCQYNPHIAIGTGRASYNLAIGTEACLLHNRTRKTAFVGATPSSRKMQRQYNQQRNRHGGVPPTQSILSIIRQVPVVARLQHLIISVAKSHKTLAHKSEGLS